MGGTIEVDDDGRGCEGGVDEGREEKTREGSERVKVRTSAKRDETGKWWRWEVEGKWQRVGGSVRGCGLGLRQD